MKKQQLKMERKKCTSCGYVIFKSAHKDPYICRECEGKSMDTERYAFLDNA
ncbi:hypothetical protein ISS07_00835 [Candidatus Woesearchaeota archaeon]|nr:hypothetical protein [Candidatus Woesearchaeota archaeon]